MVPIASDLLSYVVIIFAYPWMGIGAQIAHSKPANGSPAVPDALPLPPWDGNTR